MILFILGYGTFTVVLLGFVFPWGVSANNSLAVAASFFGLALWGVASANLLYNYVVNGQYKIHLRKVRKFFKRIKP